MSFIQSFSAKADVAYPRNLSPLNVISILLLGITFFLPLVSALIVLVLSMLFHAAFFRVMHREKVSNNKLLSRLALMVISSATIMIILFRHHLL